MGAIVIGGAIALTSCDNKTVGKAPAQTSTSNPGYTGTTSQVATSTIRTTQTTTTTTSKYNVDNKKRLDAPGCNKECFSPGCVGCNSVVVVAREGKTNKGNKRFNATITVYSVEGEETTFVGSTLPDDIHGRYDNGIGYAIVKPGTYKITRGDNHANAAAYNVQTLDDGWYVPCIRDSNSGWIEDNASGILVHRAEDGQTNTPWSTGCITIEGVDNMNQFAELVGPSAFLIIERS